MNVRLVLMLAALGLLIGIGSVTGLIHTGVESIIWLVVLIVTAVAVLKLAPGRPFRHGFVAMFIGGLLSQLVVVLFFDRYLSLNADAAVSFERLPRDLPPRIFVLLCSPLMAAFFGLLAGTLSWAMTRVFARKRTPAT